MTEYNVKPTRWQYFFAGYRPVIIWMVTFLILCPLAVGLYYWPAVEQHGDWNHWLKFFGIELLGLLLGYFSAILVGWFVLGPLFYDRSLKNGEPFHEGDLVQILFGPYRDRIARVDKAWDAAPWAGGHQIQVALGEQARQDGSDVFESRQIVRISRSENVVK